MNKKIASIVLAGSLLAPQATPLSKPTAKSIPPHVKKYLPSSNTLKGTAFFAFTTPLIMALMKYTMQLEQLTKKDMFFVEGIMTLYGLAGGYILDLINNPDKHYNKLQRFNGAANEYPFTIVLDFIQNHPQGITPHYWSTNSQDVYDFVSNFSHKEKPHLMLMGTNKETLFKHEKYNVASSLRRIEIDLRTLKSIIKTYLSDWRNEEYHTEYYQWLQKRFIPVNEQFSQQILSLAEYLENPEKFDA